MGCGLADHMPEVVASLTSADSLRDSRLASFQIIFPLHIHPQFLQFPDSFDVV